MKKDILINLVITIGISLSLFLTNKYFALYLGVENLGLMRLFTQMLAYLNLAEIGISTASAYAFYKPLLEKDYKKISIVLNTISSLYNKIFWIVLIIGLMFNTIIPFLIKTNVKNENIYLYWTMYVISTAFNYVYIKYCILFTADQKYGFVRLVEGISRIFCQVVQIFIIIKYQSFFWFIIILIINNCIQYYFYHTYFKKYYNYIIKTTEKQKSITKDLKNLFWHKLAGLVVFNTDLILISKFISLEIVGIYSSYLLITQMVVKILNIVLNVLKPKVGKFIVEHSKTEVFFYFKSLNILFLGISLVFTFCAYKLINGFMLLWLGKKFILPTFTVILILINLFISSFRGIIDIFKEAAGFFDDIYLPISESIINFVVSIVLVHYLGLNGVVIGTICSNIIIICIAKPALVFVRCFGRNVGSYIKIYINYLILIMVSLFILSYIGDLLKLNVNISWLDWIMDAFIIGIISLIVVFIVFLSNRDFRFCLQFIKRNN